MGERMTSKEPENRNEKLKELFLAFQLALAGLGVDSSLISAVPPGQTQEQMDIKATVLGTPESIINMLAAIINQLRPVDFNLLLLAMQENPVFAAQRSPQMPADQNVRVN